MKMKITIMLIGLATLVGCVKEQDFITHQKDVDDRLKAVERYSSYYNDPIVFEVSDADIDIDDNEITGVIRSLDERVSGKTIFLDTIIEVFSGDTKVTEGSAFLYLNDGVGKIDSYIWIQEEDAAKINPSKELNLKFRLRGWGEMFPGEIEQK